MCTHGTGQWLWKERVLRAEENAGKNLHKVEETTLRAELYETLILSAHLPTAFDISSCEGYGDQENQRSFLLVFLTLNVQILPWG